MNLIKDVQTEINALDQTAGSLRKFSLLFVSLGSVIFLLALRKDNIDLQIISAAFVLFFLLGVIWPSLVKKIHIGWMAFAFLLGWIVSRTIMICLFYVILTPFGFIARLFGKKFIETGFHTDKSTYWIAKAAKQNVDYRKIF